MKKISLLLFVCMLIISCSKNDDDLSGKNHLTAKIDGTDWSADIESSNTSATLYHDILLSISGSETDPTIGSFLFNIRNYKGVGSYTVGVGSADKSYGRFTTGSVANSFKSWNAEIDDNDIGTGTVVITSDNGKAVAGTFTLSLYNKKDMNTKKITEGSFELPLKTD